jgi:hypothetical protein
MRSPSELAARYPEAPRAVAAASATRSWAQPALDCAFLAVAVVVSLVVYVWSLGFYLDDYATLWRMSASDDQSLFGLYDAVRPSTGQRPLQAGIFAFLYRLFGLDPLGYHLFNAALLVSIAVLLYLVLRELRLPRAVCVAVPLVYSMLPHYASERFWLNAFQISLSTAFYLLSLYAALRAVRASTWAFGGWLAIAVVGIAGSLLSYELAFPLFALNLALVWWASRQSGRTRAKRGRLTAIIAVLAVGMVAVGVLKTAAVATHGQNGYGIGFHGGAAHHYAYLGWGAFKVNFGTYFAAFPYVLWWIFSHQFSAGNAGVAAAVGVLAFLYIWPLARAEHTVRTTSGVWRALVGGGLVALVLGYSTFLAASTFLFRSAGIDNRINAAAALGVAAALVGGIAWVAQRLAPRHGDVVFAGGVALVVAAGALVIQTLGTFWTKAADRQHTVMAAILADARSIPAGGTFILDGTCPEVGPTPVFADDADLVAALKIKLGGRAPARADVASDGLRAAGGRLALTLRFADHSDTRTYPLNQHLVVYDYAGRRITRLATEARARSYIARRQVSSCAPLRSFAWGFNPGRRWSPA